MTPDVFVLRHSKRPGELCVYGPPRMDDRLAQVTGAEPRTGRAVNYWTVPLRSEVELREVLKGWRGGVRWPTNL